MSSRNKDKGYHRGVYIDRTIAIGNYIEVNVNSRSKNNNDSNRNIDISNSNISS